MNKILFLGLTAVLLAPLANRAQASTLLTVTPDYTFIPKAFDNNDNVQIVLHGTFRGVCDRLAPSKFSVDLQKQKIVVKNQAYATPNCVSIAVNTPYTSVLNLGNLPAGSYQVYTLDSNGKESYVDLLPVKNAPDSTRTDNFIYAQVDEVNTVKVSKINTLPIILKGFITNACLSLKEVRVNLTAGNVYDILPIMENNGGPCKVVKTPFETSVELPNFPTAPTLLNVRALGGQSVERVIDTTGILD